MPPTQLMSPALKSMLNWIMNQVNLNGKRVYGIGDLKFVLTEEQRRDVTSPACIEAMRTNEFQRSGIGANMRKAKGAKDTDFDSTKYKIGCSRTWTSLRMLSVNGSSR